jgi:hypothetical protein
MIYLYQDTVEAWIRRRRRLQNSDIPEVDHIEACGVVTAESVRGWFRHSGLLDGVKDM